MSEKNEWLQFFADGASGGTGGEGAAAAGETAADAGRTLEELGVPEEKADRYRQRLEKRRAKSAGRESPAQAAPAAGAEAAGQEPTAKAGTDWDTFFSVKENKDRLSQMMAERGRSATEAKNAAAAQIEKLSPTIELLARKYHIEPGEDGSFDLDKINEAAASDDSYYEDRALEMGVSVDVARRLDQADALERQQKAQQERMQRQAMLQQHFESLQQQGRKLQEIFPDFNLEEELKNPDFLMRTAPGPNGMSVEDAYYSIHHDDIMRRKAEAFARQARQDAAASVASGSTRPRENGSSATAAVNAEPNLWGMSRQARLEYIKRKYPPRT